MVKTVAHMIITEEQTGQQCEGRETEAVSQRKL